ncbi:hypothetical protein Ddc_11181 [Ditylenchus destructor]|nr:hypothetical protein Ddc_11181 [Ditylenchus destructor]
MKQSIPKFPFKLSAFRAISPALLNGRSEVPQRPNPRLILVWRKSTPLHRYFGSCIKSRVDSVHQYKRVPHLLNCSFIANIQTVVIRQLCPHRHRYFQCMLLGVPLVKTLQSSSL